MQAQVETTTVPKKTEQIYSYFHEKRFEDQNQVIGCGSDLLIQNRFEKPRGIRPWERAKFENDIRRARQDEFYRNQKLVQQHKNKHFIEAKKAEKEAMEKMKKDEEEKQARITEQMREINRQSGFVETSGNDAWDD